MTKKEQRIELLRGMGDQILRLNRIKRRHVGRVLREAGCAMPEFIVLFRLSREGGAPQAELAVDSELDPAVLSRLVQRLGTDGLVKVAVDPADRRRRLVSITAKGRRRFEKLVPAVDDVMLHAMRGVTDADARTITRLLKKVEGS